MADARGGADANAGQRGVPPAAFVRRFVFPLLPSGRKQRGGREDVGRRDLSLLAAGERTETSAGTGHAFRSFFEEDKLTGFQLKSGKIIFGGKKVRKSESKSMILN